MGWPFSKKAESGWMAIALQPTELSVVHGLSMVGARPLIVQIGCHPLEGESAEGVKSLAKRIKLDRYKCEVLMSAGEYQLLTVEAPNVPPLELKSAVRWSVQGLIDFHIDDATVDVLDIPPDPASAGASHSMYAVVTRNDTVKGYIDEFHAADIPLSVIDIAETAQRNIGALFEDESGRGVALLYVADTYSLLTINFKAELYLARRIELGLDQLLRYEGEARAGVLDRILLEIQRTLDVFERQYRSISVGKLVVGPEPKESGLVAYLAGNLDLAVQPLELGDVIDFAEDPPPDSTLQWKLFHLIGASLRHNAKTL